MPLTKVPYLYGQPSRKITPKPENLTS